MATIKRYSNRKLYDTDARCYVTLEEIGEMVRRGEDVTVVDHVTGADLTAIVLSQIIFRTEKKIGGMLSQNLLSGLIRRGEQTWDDMRSGLNTLLDPVQMVEDEIRRRLDVLASEGHLSEKEARRLRDLLLLPRLRRTKPSDLPQEEQPADPEELEALLRQLDDLEKQIEELEGK